MFNCERRGPLPIERFWTGGGIVVAEIPSCTAANACRRRSRNTSSASESTPESPRRKKAIVIWMEPTRRAVNTGHVVEVGLVENNPVMSMMSNWVFIILSSSFSN